MLLNLPALVCSPGNELPKSEFVLRAFGVDPCTRRLWVVWFVWRCLGSQGLPWQGSPPSPKWQFPPRNGRFWELTLGKAVVNVSVLVAGLNPPGEGTKISIFPLFGEYSPTAEPRGWVLAQVAKSEGFMCGQLV